MRGSLLTDFVVLWSIKNGCSKRVTFLALKNIKIMFQYFNNFLQLENNNQIQIRFFQQKILL